MEVLDTPVGRLGIVISKDAWMVDVNDRFDAKGANVDPPAGGVQRVGVRPRPRGQPDIFKEGGFGEPPEAAPASSST